MSEQLEQTSCCEVSYDIINDAGMMNAVSTVDCLTLLLNCPHPPPDIAVEFLTVTPLPLLPRLSLIDDQSRGFYRDKDTYLLTRRLRL